MAELHDERAESAEAEVSHEGGAPPARDAGGGSADKEAAEPETGGFAGTAEMAEAFEVVEGLAVAEAAKEAAEVPAAAEGAAEDPSAAVESAEYAGLTEEQVALEREFMKGIPRINIGALFLPPIWGPAHGIWATILYYPIWLFADNAFYAAYTERTVLSLVIAALIFVTLTVATVVFAVLGQPFAAHRAASRGVKKEDYLRRERVWAIVCVVVGLAMIALAAYYNIVVRPTLGEL